MTVNEKLIKFVFLNEFRQACLYDVRRRHCGL